MNTQAEQETTIRWDQEERVAHLYTARQVQADRWIRLGYPVEVFGRDRQGKPRGWAAQVPMEAIRFRRVQDGAVVKRRGHGKGRPFEAVQHDQLVTAKYRAASPAG